jgi:hypothetical protein
MFIGAPCQHNKYTCGESSSGNILKKAQSDTQRVCNVDAERYGSGYRKNL